MPDVIGFVTGPAVKAEMIGSEEPWEGITSMVMVTHFDENDVFVLGRALENNLIVVLGLTSKVTYCRVNERCCSP